MDIWLQCWMRQMMNKRVATVDEGEIAAELCLAVTLTYPVPCLCEMVKQVSTAMHGHLPVMAELIAFSVKFLACRMRPV